MKTKDNSSFLNFFNIKTNDLSKEKVDNALSIIDNFSNQCEKMYALNLLSERLPHEKQKAAKNIKKDRRTDTGLAKRSFTHKKGFSSLPENSINSRYMDSIQYAQIEIDKKLTPTLESSQEEYSGKLPEIRQEIIDLNIKTKDTLLNTQQFPKKYPQKKLEEDPDAITPAPPRS